MRFLTIVLLALAAWCQNAEMPGGAARADVRLSSVFGNNMVLQQDMPVPVWGRAVPGEQVTVAFLGQTKTTTTDKAGNWKVTLEPLKAGGPYSFVVSGKNKIELENVLVGEVWVCSGQSNMAWALGNSKNAAELIGKSDNPNLRLCRGSWQPSSPKSSEGFSAVAYHFGQALQAKLGVPVGLITRSVSGTSARRWTSQKAVAADPDLAPYAEAIGKSVASGSLYESHIRPLIPYAIRGVIWYQGESDAARPDEYAVLFKTMIRSWRSDWGQGDFPFLYVGLGAISSISKDPNIVGWGPIREAQDAALTLPKTACANFIDSDSSLHPLMKHLAGERLALAARAVAYGEKIVSAGPTFNSFKSDGDKVIVTFDNIGEGLETKGGKLVGFAIAGKDGAFHWAEGKIESNTVVLSSKMVTSPSAVRYAFSSNPRATLYNRAGLPAQPFRSDKPTKE